MRLSIDDTAKPALSFGGFVMLEATFKVVIIGRVRCVLLAVFLTVNETSLLPPAEGLIDKYRLNFWFALEVASCFTTGTVGNVIRLSGYFASFAHQSSKSRPEN